MSKGEERIIQLLKQGKLRFEREKRFTDLRKGRYRFDFYVYGAGPKPCIIEYNGEGHYMQIPKFHRTRAEFVAAQERDRRKISYCLANSIPLFIIPYWELDNIHTAADLFQEKYRARNRWKNDYDWSKFDKSSKF